MVINVMNSGIVMMMMLMMMKMMMMMMISVESLKMKRLPRLVEAIQ